VAQAQQYIAEGHGWCVDLDLEKFFDRVNHDKLMGQIAKRVEDKQLLKLIRAFLNAGVMETRWVRLRLRGAMWRQWETPGRRRAALLALGVRSRLANSTAGSGLGPWYLARAKALSVGLSNAYFKSLGLPTLIDGC
jgi:hypothetical protein